MQDLSLPPDRELAVSALADKYLWWQSIDPAGHPIVRKMAQVMHLGTYEDIRRLERVVEAQELADVMRFAQSGWFDARSWDFWRGRLHQSGQRNIPVHPPVRAFLNAQML